MQQKLFSSAVLVSLCGLILGNAHAADVPRFEPKVIVAPQIFTVPARSIDILGISPGMTVDEVKALLSKALPGGSFSEPSASIQINFRGANIRTTDFTNYLTDTRADNGTGNDETVFASFSGPASGNQNIGLRRQINYREVLRAPSVADVRQSLLAKYGQPSQLSSVNGSYYYLWSYSKGSFVTCTPMMIMTECRQNESQNYDIPQLSRYTGQWPADFVMEATINNQPQDPSKVGTFVIRYVAFTKRAVAAKADLESLLAEGSRIMALQPQASVPSL